MKTILSYLLLSLFAIVGLQAQNITFSIHETSGNGGLPTDCSAKIASFDLYLAIDEPNWELRSYNVWTTYSAPEFTYYDDNALLSINGGDTDDGTNGQYRVAGVNGTTVIPQNTAVAFHTVRYTYTNDLDLLNQEITVGGTVLVYGYGFNSTVTLVNHVTGNSVGLVVTQQGNIILNSQTFSCIGNPPLAVDDGYTILENASATVFDVTANDSDPDGNIDYSGTNITCTTCNGTSNGTLVNNGDGTFTYTPNANYTGADNFVYEIIDTYGLTSTANVNITINQATPDVQEIILPVGWRIISTYIDPDNPDIVDVFSSVSANMFLVKNGNGDVYWPAFGINQIGNHIVGQAYKVNMNAIDTLVVTGTEVVPELTSLNIHVEWSYLGYLRTSSASIETLLNSIVSDIIIVKNSFGAVYWPALTINTIGDMNPGEGYQIRMYNAVSYTYPANGTIGQTAKNLTIYNTSHFTEIKNTGSNMTIGIPLMAWPVLPEQGDELAVFNNNGDLLGASVFTNQAMSITIWGVNNLSTKAEGIENGETFHLMLWDNSNNSTCDIPVEAWQTGSDIYFEDAISIIDKIAAIQSDKLEFSLMQNTPNPFRDFSTICYTIPENAYVKLEVYNYLGELVELVVNNKLKAGVHTSQIDAGNYKAGSYFIKLSTGNNSASKVITVIK